MSDAAPADALPFNPPSIEESVNEHIRVIEAIKALERKVRALSENHGRLADEQTVTRLTAESCLKKLNAIAKHLGVPNG